MSDGMKARSSMGFDTALMNNYLERSQYFSYNSAINKAESAG
jgi:hypothetical protein